MITEIILCDKCKKMIANSKCELCGMDLCEGCSSINTIKIYGVEYSDINKINFCSNCKYDFKINRGNIIDLNGKIKNDIIETIKKLKLANAIGSSKKSS